MTDATDIIAFLQSMDEPGMAQEVAATSNRLEAFAAGLDRDCMEAQRRAFKAVSQQLEAAQAREAKLREVLDRIGFSGAQLIPEEAMRSVWDLQGKARKALLLPTDDSALKERLKAEREAIIGLVVTAWALKKAPSEIAIEIRARGDAQ